jgi:hypothetical protein
MSFEDTAWFSESLKEVYRVPALRVSESSRLPSTPPEGASMFESA